MSLRKQILIFFTISTAVVAVVPLSNIDSFLRSPKRSVLFNSDRLSGVLEYCAYRAGGVTANSKAVVAGEGGYLFLGNSSEEVLARSGGRHSWTDEEVQKITSKYLKMQRWYEGQGKKFLILMVPNKHSILYEQLPSWSAPGKNLATGKLVSSLQSAGVKLVDLREALLAARGGEHPLFDRFDSHWTPAGWALGYEVMMDTLNSLYGLSLKKAKYHLITRLTERGDLRGLLKMGRLLPQQISTPRIRLMAEATYSHITSPLIQSLRDSQAPMILPKKPYEWESYSLFNPLALNEEDMLLMGDSFAGVANSLLSATFQRVYKFRYNRTHPKKIPFLLKHYPSKIVIYMIGERLLGKGLHLARW